MSRSLKMTHVLLVAAFAAGLSACSAEDNSSASSAAPAASASSTGPETTVTTPPAPAASTEPASPEPTTDAATGAATDAPGEDDGAGDAGPATYLLGELSASADQPGRITVQIGDGDAQQVTLSPDAAVLDTLGTICGKGTGKAKAPHKCTVAQLDKALAAHKFPYAKVTLKAGAAVRVEVMVKR
ncbi:hypothetical protein [Streptosporangium sp. NBC_01756]|uniref:hypothetical protein n=1 Tax=Streptosporangium sp. NBC_01756 TaxID=2975950 RepID=UPI002DDA0679|nr:hypothetical protein [Streptosporangium sp. NBC_01756]WSC84615.1 hypothetical protein OIE48_30165 [Streptosporangium sp. NBC_01756]